MRKGLILAHIKMMKTRYIVLFGSVAVLAVGFVLLRNPAPMPSAQAVGESQLQVFAQPQTLQVLEDSFSSPEPVSKISKEKGMQEPEIVQVPVQSVDERGDALLFEIDALQGTPFDQAVTMPFD